jgi:hypothetical protein
LAQRGKVRAPACIVIGPAQDQSSGARSVAVQQRKLDPAV